MDGTECDAVVAWFGPGVEDDIFCFAARALASSNRVIFDVGFAIRRSFGL